jgi:FlaA1/EpsC-like NDP-sugar epimerase
VVALDREPGPGRLRLLLDADELEGVQTVVGDVTDARGLETIVAEHGVTNVIHLAALQVPGCRADRAAAPR